MDKKRTYYGTVTWSDIVTGKDQSKTIKRNTFTDLVEDVKEYTVKYKERLASFEQGAIEFDLGDGVSEWQDITGKVMNYIKLN